MKIAGRPIGDDAPCFVVAEGGVNHNGSLDLAMQLVDAAAGAGADAIKFQTFRADTLADRDAPKAPYQMERTDAKQTQWQMLRALELSAAAHETLHRHAKDRGILFASTPFDLESADLLARLGVPFFKISSGDLTYVPLLRHVGGLGRPVLMSTGMSDLNEVSAALGVLRQAGARDVALLHCVSEYPAPSGDANLRAMDTMREQFGVPVGYSDHTLGTSVAVAAAARGACIVEKHLTLDRGLPGPDHSASLEPNDFRFMVEAIRIASSSLGDGAKRPAASELRNRTVARRGVYAARDIEAGTALTPAMLVCRRPVAGVPASDFDSLVGRRVGRSIPSGAALTTEDLA